MVLKYPFPYKAWFTIASDPDNTLIADWRELNEFIWKELNLPLSNSLFIRSFNANLPEQVNLVDDPEIKEQQHDIIHTWGDYTFARGKGFDRADAFEAIAILEKNDIHPKVWVDHSNFRGNLIHRSTNGATPEVYDQSGNKLVYFEYTLDLIEQIGIKYIWDGEVVDIVGQDRELEPSEFFEHVSTSKNAARLKGILRPVLRSDSLKEKLNLAVPANDQYFRRTFPDGRELYCFRRYGTWEDADISGLGKILSKDNIDSLIGGNGSMVAYTHLGKRPADQKECKQHIPEHTLAALRYIRERYQAKDLLVSPVSEMLDYMVLRDHIKLDEDRNTIEFQADGIRYDSLLESDLSGKKFSFQLRGFDLSKLKIRAAGRSFSVEPNLESDPSIFSLHFN